MMETADFWDRDDRSGGCSRDRSVIRRVLLEAEMRSTAMIVQIVGCEDAPLMRRVHHDHMVETLSSDRSDQAFGVRILPRTRWGRDDFSNAHTRPSPLKDLAVDAVSISV